MVKVYGYTQKYIQKLKEIDNNRNIFYNYKGLNFLSKLKRNHKNIIFLFHGSIPMKMKGKYKVIFRGYNYNIENTDIICISDFLLDKYSKNYIVNWTLETEKHKTDFIYKELFQYLLSQKKI